MSCFCKLYACLKIWFCKLVVKDTTGKNNKSVDSSRVGKTSSDIASNGVVSPTPAGEKLLDEAFRQINSDLVDGPTWD